MADFGEAVAIISIEKIGRRIIGDIEIGIAIPVIIQREHAQTLAPGIGDTSPLRNIFKCAVSTIQIQQIGSTPKPVRRAVSPHTTAFTHRLSGGIVSEIAHHIEIQISIGFKIEKSRPRAPSACGHIRLPGSVFESGIAIVHIQNIFGIAGNVEVQIAVIIRIAHSTTHAIAPAGRTRKFGNIGQTNCLIRIIAIQRIATLNRLPGQIGAINQIEIQIPIAVRVEKRTARTHRLDIVPSAPGSGTVDKMDPRLLRHFSKTDRIGGDRMRRTKQEQEQRNANHGHCPSSMRRIKSRMRFASG